MALELLENQLTDSGTTAGLIHEDGKVVLSGLSINLRNREELGHLDEFAGTVVKQFYTPNLPTRNDIKPGCYKRFQVDGVHGTYYNDGVTIVRIAD